MEVVSKTAPIRYQQNKEQFKLSFSLDETSVFPAAVVSKQASISAALKEKTFTSDNLTRFVTSSVFPRYIIFALLMLGAKKRKSGRLELHDL